MTSFWRNNDVIIASCPLGERPLPPKSLTLLMLKPAYSRQIRPIRRLLIPCRPCILPNFSNLRHPKVKKWVKCIHFFYFLREYPAWQGLTLAMSSLDYSLQWRHNGRDSVSHHQPHDCLLNRLFRRRSKKTSKLRVTGLCAGNSPVTGEFPAQRASNAEFFSIWWRHHVQATPHLINPIVNHTRGTMDANIRHAWDVFRITG